jgi:YVTN family beta-propeller protein
MKRKASIALVLLCLLAIFTPIPWAAAQTAAPPSGLVSWWQAEGNANDVISGNNGTLVNGATFAEGIVGRAFSFNGVNQFVQVPDAPNLNFGAADSMTVSFWAYRTANSLPMHFIGKRLGCDGAPFNWQFAMDTPGFSFGRAGGSAGVPLSRLPALNTWAHFAGTYDGTTGTFNLYINGQLAGTGQGSLGPITSAPLIIGGSGTCAPFAGRIDEVQIYNRALTATEIQSIFDASNTGLPVYIANENSNNVSVVNNKTNTVQALIPVGELPVSIALVRGQSQVYVANWGSASISVIDTKTNSVTNSIPVGDHPIGIAVSADGSTAYVANFVSQTVSVISTANNTVTATIPINGQPSALALSPNGSALYVTNFTTNMLNVISTSTNTVTGTIKGVGAEPVALAVSPNGATVYVADLFSGFVTVVDTASGVVTANIRVGSSPSDIVITPNGSSVYVSNQDSSTVSVIQTSTNTVVATIPVSDGPIGVAVSSDGSNVYVANSISNIISTISVSTNTVSATVPVDSHPYGIVTIQAPPGGVRTGLEAWWRADGNANDVIGGNNGMLRGGTSFATGKIGQAFSFDGSTGFVQVPNSPLGDFGSADFSLALWVNFSAVRSGPVSQLPNVFIGKDEGAGLRNKWVFFLADGGLSFHINSPTPGPFLGPIPFNPVLGNWYHLALTKSGSTYVFYVNGVAIGSVSGPNALPAVNAPLTIGQAESLGFFNGLIDEVEIFNRALLPEEVQTIFNSGA